MRTYRLVVLLLFVPSILSFSSKFIAPDPVVAEAATIETDPSDEDEAGKLSDGLPLYHSNRLASNVVVDSKYRLPDTVNIKKEKRNNHLKWKTMLERQLFFFLLFFLYFLEGLIERAIVVLY